MDNRQADTEAVGMGRVNTRSRTEGIYNGYESEHSMEHLQGKQKRRQRER